MMTQTQLKLDKIQNKTFEMRVKNVLIAQLNQSINQSTGLFVWQLKTGLKHAYN